MVRNRVVHHSLGDGRTVYLVWEKTMGKKRADGFRNSRNPQLTTLTHESPSWRELICGTERCAFVELEDADGRCLCQVSLRTAYEAEMVPHGPLIR